MSVVGMCGNDTVLLSWEESVGVLMYTVTAVGDLGYTLDFITTNTSLEAKLPCGQTFSFRGVARGEQCDSRLSDMAYFTTSTARTLSFNNRLPLYMWADVAQEICTVFHLIKAMQIVKATPVCPLPSVIYGWTVSLSP